MTFPRGVADAGINLVLHRLPEGGGPAFEQDEPGVGCVRRRHGTGERGGRNKFGGTFSCASGSGDNAALGGGREPYGGSGGGGHEAQL